MLQLVRRDAPNQVVFYLGAIMARRATKGKEKLAAALGMRFFNPALSLVSRELNGRNAEYGGRAAANESRAEDRLAAR
jgi:hypothetical protein